MSNDREKIIKRRQRRRRRRLKPTFKIFLFFMILIISGGTFLGIKYYHLKHAPDPYGKLEDIQNAQNNNYDLTDEVMPEAKYWIINVGDGEAIFIKCGQTDILIDTGAEKNAKAVIDTIGGEITGKLDYLLITSTSARRIGGIKKICDEFQPKEVITGPLGDKTKEITFAVPGRKVEEGVNTTITLGENFYLSIFRPEVSSDDPYDQSLMTLFTYGDTAFFAESDAGEEEEARVIEQISKCDALVLSRAGSDSVNQHIADISCPIYIASCKKGSGPSAALVDAVNGSIYATYSSGTIKFSTNGKDVTSNLEDSKRITEIPEEEVTKEQ